MIKFTLTNIINPNKAVILKVALEPGHQPARFTLRQVGCAFSVRILWDGSCIMQCDVAFHSPLSLAAAESALIVCDRWCLRYKSTWYLLHSQEQVK